MTATDNIQFPQFEQNRPTRGRQGELFMRPSEILKHYAPYDWMGDAETDQIGWNRKLRETKGESPMWGDPELQARDVADPKATPNMYKHMSNGGEVPPVPLNRGSIMGHHRVAAGYAIERERGEYYLPINEVDD